MVKQASNDVLARRLLRGDCLCALDADYSASIQCSGLEVLAEHSVDLIYLDPPFNSKQHYNLPFQALIKAGKADAKAVSAFEDTWSWDQETHNLRAWAAQRWAKDRKWAAICRFLDALPTILRRREPPLTAYLLHMAVRLLAMRRVLKPTGSLYLHCDPTASHYLKILMDAIYGEKNFLNEVVWSYRKWTNAARYFQRNHDILLAYSKERGQNFFEKLFDSDAPQQKKYERGWDVNVVEGGIRQLLVYDEAKAEYKIGEGNYDRIVNMTERAKVALPDCWQIPILNSQAVERLGYPTQKPLALLERIIRASCPEGGVVLDPFCGCGTALETAEKLNRRWIGIDISLFASQVVRHRLQRRCSLLPEQILERGTPNSAEAARELARQDPFEFEKWACGKIGAAGLYKNPGARGPDGGIDGVIEFNRNGGRTHAIVQVKGGRVTREAVRALYTDVTEEPQASAGVLVCFERYRTTAEKHRSKKTFQGNFPVVQVLTIEELLAGKFPNLPVDETGWGRTRSYQTKLDL